MKAILKIKIVVDATMWQAMRQATYDFRDVYNAQGGSCTVVDLP